MDMIKNEKGITLVALAVTIIVLLILTGISLIIAHNLIIDKAILASNKTIEALLQEQIEMAWVDVEASYWIDIKNNPNKDKKEYFWEEFPKKLEDLEDLDNVTVNFENEITYINLKHKNKDYQFSVSKEGRVNYIVLLKGNVKVGDYVEYPIEYIDVYSKKQYTTINGWRVIDDGVMQGTSGQVRLISSGIPAKWFYDCGQYESSKNAVDDLINNFENLELLDSIDGSFIKGNAFNIETIAEKVTTISLNDLNNIYNKIHNTNRDINDISEIETTDELFYYTEKSYYWLATNSMENDKEIYFVAGEKIRHDFDVRNGIRPVICLKDGLSAIVESGVWKIMN